MKRTVGRKILYSPGFGAGWSTWSSGEVAKHMLTYQPIIDALERGEKVTEGLLDALCKECKEKFGEEPYCGGADQLEVAVVKGRVRIHEYDGSESVEEENDFQGWM